MAAAGGVQRSFLARKSKFCFPQAWQDAELSLMTLRSTFYSYAPVGFA